MTKVGIFLVDVREPPDLPGVDWEVARNMEQFQALICKHLGDKLYIVSLDHDLGTDPVTGFTCLRWLLNNRKVTPDSLYVTCHSMNPVGYANITNEIVSWILRKSYH